MLLSILERDPGPADRAAILGVAKTLSSSNDQTRVLRELLAWPSLDDDAAIAVGDVAMALWSSSDRESVLRDVVVRTPRLRAARSHVIQKLQLGSSSHAGVLLTMASQGDLDEADQLRLINAAYALSSSSDQTDVLVALVRKGNLTDANRRKLSAAVNRIYDSSNRKRVIDALIGN